MPNETFREATSADVNSIVQLVPTAQHLRLQDGPMNHGLVAGDRITATPRIANLKIESLVKTAACPV